MEQVKYPYSGEYVVTVGKQPVYSNADKAMCDLKAQQLRLDNMRSGDVGAEHEVKVGQVIVEDRDFREGKIVY